MDKYTLLMWSCLYFRWPEEEQLLLDNEAINTFRSLRLLRRQITMCLNGSLINANSLQLEPGNGVLWHHPYTSRSKTLKLTQRKELTQTFLWLPSKTVWDGHKINWRSESDQDDSRTFQNSSTLQQNFNNLGCYGVSTSFSSTCQPTRC